jgi:hypothetical protein
VLTAAGVRRVNDPVPTIVSAAVSTASRSVEAVLRWGKGAQS